MRRQVGVDIGSTAVRVVEVRGIDNRGFAVVSRVGFSPLREGAILGGKVKNPVAVSQALQRALKQAGVAPYGFVTGYSAPEVAVTRMQLPGSLKGDERVKSIRTMEHQISASMRLDESVLAVNEIRKFSAPNGAPIAAVVVAAAHEAEVNALRQVFKLAKCQPKALDLSGAAIMRALVRTPVDSADVHTVVDVGATKTSIATRQGPHLRSIRQIPVGGEAFVRAIIGVTGDDREAAQARVKVVSLSGSAATAASLSTAYGSSAGSEPGRSKETLLDEALNTVAEDLVEQIAAAIENDAASYGNTLTRAVVLCGAPSQIPGLRDRLSGRLGVPVKLGRPWAVLERSRSNLLLLKDGREDPRMMMELATAIGLALWKETP